MKEIEFNAFNSEKLLEVQECRRRWVEEIRLPTLRLKLRGVQGEGRDEWKTGSLSVVADWHAFNREKLKLKMADEDGWKRSDCKWGPRSQTEMGGREAACQQWRICVRSTEKRLKLPNLCLGSPACDRVGRWAASSHATCADSEAYTHLSGRVPRGWLLTLLAGSA